MKRLMLVTLAALTGYAWGAEQKTALNIMPLGDSITYGVGGSQSGYRYFLERDLIREGYQPNYLGTSTDNACANLKDPDHCGFNGLYLMGDGANNLHDNIGTWLNQTGAPDIILLHIGTNDAKAGVPLTDRPKALDETLDTIVAKAPNAHVIVSTVLQRTDDVAKDDNIRTNFNAYIEGIVSSHVGKGENIHYLDLRACLTYPDDLSDGLHPNDSGYLKMSNAWLGEIKKIYEPAPVPAEIKFATVQDKTHLQLAFTTPLTDTMTDVNRYFLGGGRYFN